MKPLLFAFFNLLLLTAGAQTRFRVMTYNVENAFDTIHDEGKQDTDFLPAGRLHWDTPKYRAKLSRIAAVIAGVGEIQPPKLVALCEVENERVIEDLLNRTRLHSFNYRYCMTESADLRGIDVALLYQPSAFHLLYTDTLRVMPADQHERPTRDILHVCGLVPSGDTLSVFVVHLPSRRGGVQQTSSRRCRLTQRLRQEIDALTHDGSNRKIVIMGDFNDEYTDSSIASALAAQKWTDAPQPPFLCVLTADLKAAKGIRGTHKFQGRWAQLDQVIVNDRLLTTSGLHTTPKDCFIFADAPLLKYDAADHGAVPYRSFLGAFYQGGFSDHLPVVVDFFY